MPAAVHPISAVPRGASRGRAAPAGSEGHANMQMILHRVENSIFDSLRGSRLLGPYYGFCSVHLYHSIPRPAALTILAHDTSSTPSSQRAVAPLTDVSIG